MHVSKQPKVSTVCDNTLEECQDEIVLEERGVLVETERDSEVVENAVDTEKEASVVDNVESQGKGVDAVRREEAGDGRSSSCSSSSGSSSSSSIDEAAKRDASLKNRVFKILSRGAMPLSLPARRDWGKTEITISVDSIFTLSWPPKNWQKLSSDQRLLAREYAAVCLEKKGSDEFPTLSRTELLDKYNFLSLDGEAKPRKEKNPDDAMEAKMRQQNFEYLKGIVKHNINDSIASWSFVKCLEKADRWGDTDRFIDFLEGNGIELRL